MKKIGLLLLLICLSLTTVAANPEKRAHEPGEFRAIITPDVDSHEPGEFRR